jgi:hypothetical protein
MRSIIFYACMTLMISCDRQPESAYQTLVDHLEGTWQLKNHPVIEQWSLLADRLEGRVFSFLESDTTITETLRIFQQYDALWYEATVLDQNDGKPVLFKLTETTENSWLFENREHNFPQNIKYKFQYADTLVATIEGETGEGWKSIEFWYFRIK